MEYEVIHDFLYLNEPIYRRVTGVPQARLVSSGIGHAVNVEPIDNNQHGVYPWSAAAAGPAAGPAATNAARAAPRAYPMSIFSDYGDFARRRISRADGERLVKVGYGVEGLQGVLDPANANRVYYQRQRVPPLAETIYDFSRLGTLVRHFLRSGDRNVQTELFFSENPDRSYSVGEIFYDPFQFLRPTTAPVIGLPTQGGYKRSTTSRNKKKKQKLIRRTAASRSRKRRSSTTE